VTTTTGVRVQLTFADWTRLITLVVVVLAALGGFMLRQEQLIRDVSSEVRLLQLRVTNLEETTHAR